MRNQFFNFNSGFRCYKYLVTVDPITDRLNEFVAVLNMYKIDLQCFLILFHKKEYIVPEFNERYFGSKNPAEFILNNQQIIGVNVYKTKRTAVFKITYDALCSRNDEANGINVLHPASGSVQQKSKWQKNSHFKDPKHQKFIGEIRKSLNG